MKVTKTVMGWDGRIQQEPTPLGWVLGIGAVVGIAVVVYGVLFVGAMFMR